MEQWLQDFFGWLPDGWRYLGFLGLIAFLEGLPVAGLLIPGSTLVLFAGFLALHGKGSLLAIIGITTVGAILGDCSSYLLGARAGSRLLQSRVLRRRHRLVHQAEIFFAAHGGKSICFARFVGPVRGLVPFIAGGTGMRPRVFWLYALLSGLLWGVTFPGLGYLAGASWQRVALWSERFTFLLGMSLFIILLIAWWRHRRLIKTSLNSTKALQESEISPKMPASPNDPEDPRL